MASRTLFLVDIPLAVCRLEPRAPVPAWATQGEFSSVTRTPQETSVVCPATAVPDGLRCEVGWRALGLRGPIDFGETGVLAGLVGPLAAAAIPVFAISTFDTDYLLVRVGDLERAVLVLSRHGYRVEGRDA